MRTFAVRNLSEVLYKTLSIKHLNKKKMEKLVKQIEASFNAFLEDANSQVEKGNKAAGQRARKASLDLEKSLKEFRKVSIDASKK